MKVISIGEVLWDVVDGKEHLGGAPFNFTAHLHRFGHQVYFVSAVGNDDRGKRILHRMENMGLSTRFMREDQKHATGIVSVTLSNSQQPSFVLHRPAAYDFPQVTAEGFDFLLSQAIDWIYFGTLLQMSSTAWETTREILATLPATRRFYDVNLRSNAYTPDLLRQLMQMATVMKLNDFEVEEISRMFGTPFSSLEQFCRDYAGNFQLDAVCVTRGSKGCALLLGEEYAEAPGYPIKVADTIGAGDAFAAGFLHGLGEKWPAKKIGDFANRIGALVASRPAAIPAWTLDEIAGFDAQTYRLERA